MTYRVRLQWPDQRVSNKTTTESEAVANYAFCDLLSTHAGRNAAASMTRRRQGQNKAENLRYFDLANAEPQQCRRCTYNGAFIDDAETCPNCKLVQ